MTQQPLSPRFYFFAALLSLCLSLALSAAEAGSRVGSGMTEPIATISSAIKPKAPRLIAEYNDKTRKEIDAQKLSPSSLGDFDPVWKIDRSLKKLRWQQDLKKGEKLVVELQSEAGLPWPSKGARKIGDGIQEFELTPKKRLPKNRHMYVIAHVLDEKGKRKETWLKKVLLN